MTVATLPERTTQYRSRQEWLDGRGRGAYIGGSEVPIILGLSHWSSPYELWAKKVAQAERSPESIADASAEEAEQNEFALWGHLLEATILKEVARRAELEVVGREFRIWRHATNPAFRYSPDGEVVAPWRGTAEIKNRSEFKADDWQDGTPPLDVVVQVQWGLGVSGYERAVVGALIGGNRLVYSIVERHDELIRGLEATAEEFLDRVRTKRAPETDGSDATGRALRALYPVPTGDVIDLSDEIGEEFARLTVAKAQRKAADEVIATSENKIKAALGPAIGGRLPNDAGTLWWKSQHRDAYVVDAADFRVLRHEKPKQKKGKA